MQARLINNDNDENHATDGEVLSDTGDGYRVFLTSNENDRYPGIWTT